MNGVSREVLKWLQGLDLSYSVKNPKRDFSNGFLVAEILSRYYRDVPMHAFDNGTSLVKKMDNWELLQRILGKNGLTLARDTVEGVIHQKNGCAVPMLEQLYTHLTKRVVQSVPPMVHEEVPKPMFALPTLSTKMRNAHPQGEHVTSKLVPDTDKTKALNEAVLAEHEEANRQVKLSNPHHFIPKPRVIAKPSPPKAAQNANVTFKQVTVKSVDQSIVALHSVRGEGKDEAGDKSPKEGAAAGESRQPAESLHSILSAICQDCFSEMGVAFEADDAASPTGSNPRSQDYIAFFIMNLTNSQLSTTVKTRVWGALKEASNKLASLIIDNPAEFYNLVSSFGHAFDALAPNSDDFLQAQELIIQIGKHVAAHDCHLSTQLFVTFFLSRHRASLLSQTEVAKREALLRMFHAYTGATLNSATPSLADSLQFRLDVIHTLQNFLVSPASATSQMPALLSGPTEITLAPVGGFIGNDSQTFPIFLLCLSFLSSCQGSMPRAEIGDIYSYYAAIGLSSASPIARAAALSILNSVVSKGYVSNVTRYLDRLTDLSASAEGSEWWEVSAQMTLLCATLLDAILPCSGSPPNTPDGTDGNRPPSARRRSAANRVEGDTMTTPGFIPPSQCAAFGRVIHRLLQLCFTPNHPVPCRKVGLVALAHRCTVEPQTYLDEQVHKGFLIHFTNVLMSLPSNVRRSLLEELDEEASKKRQTAQTGSVQDYPLITISTLWEPLAVANSLCDYLRRKRGSGTLPTRDLRAVMEVLAHGVLGTRFVDANNRGAWFAVLKEIEGDIRHGIHAVTSDEEARKDVELHELLVHIVTKLYLELTDPELPKDATLETVQYSALEWFMARQ